MKLKSSKVLNDAILSSTGNSGTFSNLNLNISGKGLSNTAGSISGSGINFGRDPSIGGDRTSVSNYSSGR
jgi:hypothetical protein